MTQDLKIFESSEFGKLGVMTIEGKEHFPATDCAKTLGHKNPQEAIRVHCKGVREILTPSAGGMQKKKFIPEGDLYRLIVKSKLPSAEKFERWVFDEVLPSIRQTGGYIPINKDDDDSSIMAKALMIAQKTLDNKDKLLKQQQEQITEMLPKVEFTDKLLKSKDNILVREYAKVLQDEGFNLGEKKLYTWFRDNEYLMRNNEPYQRYIKYFVVVERVVDSVFGVKITRTTKVTPEGQLYFFKKIEEYFKNEK